MTFNDLIMIVDLTDTDPVLIGPDGAILDFDYCKDNDFPVTSVKARAYKLFAYLDHSGLVRYLAEYRAMEEE